MSQRIHLAWASVSFLMVGVGFGLGSLEAEPAEHATAQSSAASPQSSAQARADLAPLGSSASPPSSSPLARRAARVEVAPQSAAPSPAPLAGAGQNVSVGQIAPPPQLAFASAPAIPMILDPDAEALIQLLTRLRLDPSQANEGDDPRARQLRFVREAVNEMVWSLAEEQKSKIYVALAALHPDLLHWPDYGETPPAELLRVRRLAYEQRRTPEALEALIRLLNEVDPETLDKGWIESLARAHPEILELQRLLASAAPERAAQVFSAGGLTHQERELLIDVVGREDTAEAARMARELLLETFEVEHLVSALGYDPEGTTRFLEARRGDPRWEELGAMARLRRVYGVSEDTAQVTAAVERYWRQLSPQRLPEVLEMLEDASWTRVEGEILEAVLASGDSDLIESVSYLAPPEVQWKLRARADRAEGDPWGTGVELEIERFLQFLDEAPFTARAALEDLYRVIPRPGERGAFRLATSFQGKGDPATAKAILERAPGGRLIQVARRQLEAGLSLEDLDEDDFLPEED